MAKKSRSRIGRLKERSLPSLERDLKAEILARVLPLRKIDGDFLQDGIDIRALIRRMSVEIDRMRAKNRKKS